MGSAEQWGSPRLEPVPEVAKGTCPLNWLLVWGQILHKERKAGVRKSAPPPWVGPQLRGNVHPG